MPAIFAFVSIAAFAANNVKVGDLWYSISNETSTASVIRNQEKNKSKWIPYEMTDIEIPNVIQILSSSSAATPIYDSYTVNKIEANAFLNCTKLRTISIPSSITYFGSDAFSGCTSLQYVLIASTEEWFQKVFANSSANPLSNNCSICNLNQEVYNHISFPAGIEHINDYAFCGCRHHDQFLEIPATVKSIGKWAFYGSGPDGESCVELHEGLETIGDYAFMNAYTMFIGTNAIHSRKSNLPNSLKEIGDYAFSNMPLLKSIHFGNGLTTIGSWAFSNCIRLSDVDFSSATSLESIGNEAFVGCPISLVELSDNITSLISSFDKTTKISVKLGTATLLSLWTANYIPYEKGTDNVLSPPTSTFISSTQTTATISLDKVYDGYEYGTGYNTAIYINGEYVETRNVFIPYDFSIDGNIVTLSGMFPNAGWVSLYKDGAYYAFSLGGSTKSLDADIIFDKITATSIQAHGVYTKGDCLVYNDEFYVKDIRSNPLYLNHLEPGTKVDVEYTVFYRYGKDNVSANSVKITRTITLGQPNLKTLQPKVVSIGNVVVAAESNIGDDEEKVGFEWRRTDWTDVFQSNSGTAYLYEGKMEGYIRNLNANAFWKYRPFFESTSGNRYYGEWIGIDPTNISYFEPTVHTYASVNVNGNTAQVRGYAQRGTDDVTEQGFKYWYENNGSASKTSSRMGASVIPSNAKTVTTSGTIMEAELTSLAYNTTYHYVAYVMTSEGETFYGDERQFQTGADPTGIAETTTPITEAVPIAYYDLNGRRLSNPRGLVIVRMSDGSSRKLVK